MRGPRAVHVWQLLWVKNVKREIVEFLRVHAELLGGGRGGGCWVFLIKKKLKNAFTQPSLVLQLIEICSPLIILKPSPLPTPPLQYPLPHFPPLCFSTQEKLSLNYCSNKMKIILFSSSLNFHYPLYLSRTHSRTLPLCVM